MTEPPRRRHSTLGPPGSPVRRWIVRGALTAAVLVGMGLGLGAVTFIYARGSSYLTDDPRACANCHVMNDQFRGWQRSSHHAVAVCNDCHAPHDLLPKVWVKALNGLHHASAFTTGGFTEPIRITPKNRAVTEAQCRVCHAELVERIEPKAPQGMDPHDQTNEMSCIRCHASVGHPSGPS